MSTVLLTAFTCGWMSLPINYLLAGEEGKVLAPATVFLIDHPKGLVLFDTGLGPRFTRPDGNDARPRFGLEEDERIGKRLESLGIDPGRVHWVINSHLHMDHAGGNCDLPNATIVVQANEWDYAIQTDDAAYHVAEFDLGQPVLRVRGEHDLFGDGSVVIFPTTGHTPGHQSARVTTPTGVAILAGDCCNMRRSLDELRLPSQCFDPEQYLATLKLLRARESLGERVFPAHDPEFWATIPQHSPLDLTALG